MTTNHAAEMNNEYQLAYERAKDLAGLFASQIFEQQKSQQQHGLCYGLHYPMPSMMMWTWEQAPQAFRDLSTCGGDEDAVLLTSYEHSIIERMANFEEPIVLHLTDGTVAYLYITSHA
jgi:hypothetical protein